MAKISDETRRKISVAHKGRKHTEETKQKIRESKLGEKNPNYGKNFPIEAKIKLIKSLTGRKRSEETKQKMRESKLGEKNPNYGKQYTEEERKIASMRMKGEKNPMYGKHRSEKTKQRLREANLGRKHTEESKKKIGEAGKGEKSGNWKGGYDKKRIPIYDTYAHRLIPIEAVRRDPKDPNILNVKCTYCGNWIITTRNNVQTRIWAINNGNGGEARFYCKGANCKSQCPIYRKLKYPKNYNPASSREVQPELRQLVLKRDNYICQKCGKNIQEVPLHCHHYEGVLINPLESADVDMCITLCKSCHKFAHTLPDCGYEKLRCK